MTLVTRGLGKRASVGGKSALTAFGLGIILLGTQPVIPSQPVISSPFLLEQPRFVNPKLARVETHKAVYAYTGKLDVIITNKTRTDIYHPEFDTSIEFPSKNIFTYTPTIEPMYVDLSSKSSYLEFLQKVRFAEDEAFILGEEFSDIDLINKVKASDYYNKYYPQINTQIALSIESKVTGSNGWLEKLLREDEEFFFADFTDL